MPEVARLSETEQLRQFMIGSLRLGIHNKASSVSAMNELRRLKQNDIIGKKVVCVYQKEGARLGRFQNTLTFVRLDTDVIFGLDALRDPDPDKPLEIWSALYEDAFSVVLSIDREPGLTAPIKSLVYAEHFANGVGILLENDFVLTIIIGEFDMGYTFYRPSEQFRKYKIIKIADI